MRNVLFVAALSAGELPLGHWVHVPCAVGIPFVQPQPPLGISDSPLAHVIGVDGVGHEDMPLENSWLLPGHWQFPDALPAPPVDVKRLPGGHVCDEGHGSPSETYIPVLGHKQSISPFSFTPPLPVPRSSLTGVDESMHSGGGGLTVELDDVTVSGLAATSPSVRSYAITI